MQWLFIGAGNMASSLIGGLMASGAPNGVPTGSSDSPPLVVDTSQDALTRIRARHEVITASSVTEALAQRQPDQRLGIVVAVKPHIVSVVCEELHRELKAAANDDAPLLPLFVSVAAGVTTQSMLAWLGEDSRLVRCMPNTPALLGHGASALFAVDHCNEEDKAAALALLSTAGLCIWVSSEQKLDAVTALSGSGPAYFFRLVELMIEAAQELGLTEEEARELAIETAFGAACMLRQRDDDPGTLRQNVTSKGGTTAAALAQFNSLGLPDMVTKAMNAARDRATEMGAEYSASSKD